MPRNPRAARSIPAFRWTPPCGATSKRTPPPRRPRNSPAPAADSCTKPSSPSGLWRNIKAYAATPAAALLPGARRRFLHKTIESFRRHGADLAAEGKKRLEEIDVELTQITTRFAENVLDSTNAFELVLTNEADLSGLPPRSEERR